MSQIKTRIEYIDIAKGILITMLALHHSSIAILQHAGVESYGCEVLSGWLNFAFVSYFMPAFFFITGYCTGERTYSLNIGDFVKKNALTLLLPMVILSHMVGWFLLTLFYSKLLCWLIKKIHIHNRYKVILYLCIAFAGYEIAYLSDTHLNGNTYQCWFNTLAHVCSFSIYLFLGEMWHRYENHRTLLKYTTLTTIYIILIAIVIKTETHLPFVTSQFLCTPLESPLLLALAVSGTIMILGISRLINKNKVFSYLGRNSLIIYLLHMYFMDAILRIMKPLFVMTSNSVLLSSVLYCTLAFITIACCALAAKIINTKYLKWMAGKFN